MAIPLNKYDLACQLLSDVEWETVKNALSTASRAYQKCAEDLRSPGVMQVGNYEQLARQFDRQVSEVGALLMKIEEW